ncbi:MAG: haloalkane dehalogenase [Gammaproteobacteria bacterium]|nr:haloalkane dehalogenase [Gammaproteobacteria bacterium]MDP6616519.1 haloalkane dehalogenase [Gammaproteobacteria bacterium]MDP6694232.1 haloalkane dehalogenase [Gammaproteobacteria bacterium]MDP7041973.1 haloalkane dehalogenase [Gammaproteobacteria bacterium]
MTEWTKNSADVLGYEMAWVEMGTGDPIVFLHGNPTSSFLWRNIMPELETSGRCIAPDLIGMGDSARLPDSGAGRYDFHTHSKFLDALLEHLDVGERVTLVVHDWGSGLGFDWARRHSYAVAGIAYMEAFVRPLHWSEWPEAIQPIFEGLRSEAGESMILDKNIFVERILPASIMRKLTDDEMDEYRRPFIESGEARRPMLDWPRQIPFDGEPADVYERVQAYADWMSANDIPKLFVNADPGAVLIGPQREFCRGWRNQTEVTVRGIHFIQEDSAAEIASALRDWHATLPG